MGRNFWSQFKPRHHSSKKKTGLSGLADFGNVIRNVERAFEKKPKTPKPTVIPAEPDTPIRPKAPPKEVVLIQEADDINQRAVLNEELQALEQVGEKEEDLLGRMATKLDPPSTPADFVKDLGEFASKTAKEEYLEENFATLSKLGSAEIQRIMTLVN